MLQQVKNPTRIHEDSGSSPGLAQWLKDPLWLQATLWVTDKAVAVVQGSSCSSNSTPSLGTSICHRCIPKKKIIVIIIILLSAYSVPLLCCFICVQQCNPPSER